MSFVKSVNKNYKDDLTFVDDMEYVFCDFFESLVADLLHVLMKCDKRTTDHFATWRLRCTLINLCEIIII